VEKHNGMLSMMTGTMVLGSKLSLGVNHKGQPRNVTVRLGEMPVKETAAAEAPTRQKSAAPETMQSRLGIAVVELTPEIAQHLKVPANVKGVVVGNVDEGSPAADAGLQLGDVVQEVNHKPVSNVSDFQSQISQRSSSPILLLVNREGHTVYAAIDGK